MNKRQKRIRKNICIAIAKEALKSISIVGFDRLIVRLHKYGYEQLPVEYFKQIIDKKKALLSPFHK